MRMIFATNNEHKLNEIREIIKNLNVDFCDLVYTMKDVGVSVSPDETGSTYEENAKIKANALFLEMQNKNLLKDGDYIVADDTGLSIDALDGAPGIKSARFISESADALTKNQKILELMENVEEKDRTANFNTCLYVIKVNAKDDYEHFTYFGKIDGKIATKMEGNGGFGYDPLFIVERNGEYKTYAEFGEDYKNTISHRARAMKEFFKGQNFI